MIIKDTVLEVDRIEIVGQLYLPDGRTPCHMVCICHGIPARIPDPGERGYPVLAEKVCGEGFGAFIFNFRGAGMSGGNIDMLGWTRDLKGVLDYLYDLPEVDRSHLSLLGFSGGAAVCIYVASQDRRISSVVSCACPAEFSLLTKTDNIETVIEHFRSIGCIRDRDFPNSIEEWLDGFRVINPIKHIAGIAPRSLLLVHGDQDETVNVSHAYNLYDSAGEPTKLVIIEGAGHRLRQNEAAMDTVLDWLKSES